MSLQILLVDDHDLFRAGLQLILQNLEQDIHVLEARDCVSALIILTESTELDLIVLDINLPDALQLECFEKLISVNLSVPIIILSAAEDKVLAEIAIQRGAQGYIPKSYSNEVILNAIRLVLSGGVYIPPLTVKCQLTTVGNTVEVRLTARQKQVLGLIDRGLTNKQIAQLLKMSEGTVKAHVNAIFRTLKVENRVSACNLARQMCLI